MSEVIDTKEENPEEVEEYDVGELEVQSIIGFDGKIIQGFHIHPDQDHWVYALGNKVSILNWKTKEQHLLTGHTNIISTVALSKSGKFIASGQINHIGFKATIIIWNFQTRETVASYEIHKVRVESIIFSCDDRYVISIGGRDCGSVLIFDMDKLQPLCGSPSSPVTAGDTYTISPTNRRGPCFLTAGNCTLRVWTVNADSRSLISYDVHMSKVRRTILCLAIDDCDEVAYCGTSTGDIMKICLNFHQDLNVLTPTNVPIMRHLFGLVPTKKKRCSSTQGVDLYGMGVRSLLLLNGRLLIGAGDGTVDMVEELPVSSIEVNTSGVKLPTTPGLRTIQRCNVRSSVSSMKTLQKKLLVCTTQSEIFSVNLENFKDVQLLITCHLSCIYTLTFPTNFSEVFATSSKEDVRIWSLNSIQELLRIRVPNFSCSSVCCTPDGKSIITGWNDGVIRAFTPLTGRLVFALLNAHNKGVSALAVTSDSKRIISGGCEGQVRIWDVATRELVSVLKEHKGPIAEIDVNRFDNEAVSASTDGTCIIWDIVRLCRKQILRRNTLFMCARYYTNAVQVLTGGTDRKIAYWEVFDGSLVRELEGSISEAINSLDISPDGELFVTGGNDQLVKLWKFNEGVAIRVGIGHTGVITSVRFAPDGKHIVSTSASGCIFVWKVPIVDKTVVEENVEDNKLASDVKPTLSKKSSCKSFPTRKPSRTYSMSKIENIRDLESARRCPEPIVHSSQNDCQKIVKAFVDKPKEKSMLCKKCQVLCCMCDLVIGAGDSKRSFDSVSVCSAPARLFSEK